MLDNSSFKKVNARNKATIEAQRAYLKGDFPKASYQFQILANQSFFTPAAVSLNLAHTLFEEKDTLAARKKYTQLLNVKEQSLASTTYLQLGIIFCQEHDTSRALALFKESLIIKPDNELARYNYELLKRLYHPKYKSPQNTPRLNNNQSMPSPPLKKQEEKSEITEDNSRKELLKTLKNYGLTSEKAKVILDGMKSNEMQYIQQRRNLVKSKNTGITKNW